MLPTRQNWFPTIVLGLALGVLLGHAGCVTDPPRQDPREAHPHDDRQSEERIVLSAEARRTVPLQTVPVQRHTLTQEIRTTAVLAANENRLAHVSPRVPGRVVEVRALLGESVEAGQMLAALDSLELGQAKAAYLTAKAHHEVARTTYEREERLWQQHISSRREYLEARGEFLRAEAQLRAARETLRLLGLTAQEITQLAWGRQKLSYLPLLAPFAGTIIEQHVTVGELLTPADRPYTIADLSTLWALVDIYEKDLGYIHRGTPARLTIDAYPGESFQGTITYISDVLAQQTRTARARVEIANPDRKLKPGMFGTAVVTAEIPHAGETIAIPTTAVHHIEEQPVAFVQEAEGVFVPRRLKLGRAAGSYVEILAGLGEGEQVVTDGGFYLKSTLLRAAMGEEHASEHRRER
jgi:cobalt-zinc-cadmium efflux system membrane fusion protein